MTVDIPAPVEASEAAIDVTVIVVNYNTHALLAPCIDSLRAGSNNLRLQIVIVDNASRDGSDEVLRRDFSDCELIFNSENVGFGRANNQALSRVRGRYVLLLNTDAFIEKGGVGQTVRYLDDHPECAVLGVRLEGRDGALQPSCRYFPTPWNGFLLQTGLDRWFSGTRLVDDMAWDHASARHCDWVPGCYYLVRTSVLDRIGLFDPRFFMYYEEVDHCRRVKAAGWEVVFFPETTVVHIGGESARFDHEITTGGRQISALEVESGLLYVRKHHGLTGVFGAVALGALGNLVLAAKGLLRRGSLRGAGSLWTRNLQTLSLLRRTHWARRPTR